MNKAILMGNLTRDPEMRTTQSQVPVCTFTLAVERRFKSASGERQADFINVVAWRQQAEFVAKYFHKGSRMVVVGSIQTRTYDDKDGNKRTATEVVADEIHFGDSKKASSGYDSQPASGAPAAPSANDGFFPAPDDDTSLPFDL
jgi:single-strand DNA-binding protein